MKRLLLDIIPRIGAALVGGGMSWFGGNVLYKLLSESSWKDPWLIILFPIVLAMVAVAGGILAIGLRLIAYALIGK